MGVLLVYRGCGLGMRHMGMLWECHVGVPWVCHRYGCVKRPLWACYQSAAMGLPTRLPLICYGCAKGLCRGCVMGAPCVNYRNAKNVLWIRAGLRWVGRWSAMGPPLVCYGYAIYMRWVCHGSAMCPPWVRPGSVVGRPKFRCGSAASLPWVGPGPLRVCYGFATGVRRVCYRYDMPWVRILCGSPTAMLRACYGCATHENL